MAIPAITNNSPSAGNIAWGAFTIQYNGTSFAIPAGSTAQRWVWWRYNTGGSTSVIEAGPDIPTNLKDDDLVLFGNKNGIGLRVQTTSYVDGELLVDGSIFADAIAANQITSTKIATAGLDAGVIKFGTMSGDRIEVNTLVGDRIVSNSITANQIATNTITANEIDVDSLTAEIINTGVIQSGLTITGSLNIDDGNMGWSKSMGLWLGNGTAFYGDERTNQIEGSLVTENISIKDGLSLGGDADIHGVMQLSDGISKPATRPALSQTWPRSESPVLSTGGSGDGATDMANVWHGLHNYDGGKWIVPFNYFGMGLRLLHKTTLDWAGDVPLGSWATKFYLVGFAILGSNWYVLGQDGNRNDDFYIYKLTNTGTIAKLGELRIGSYGVFDGKRPRLVGNGVDLLGLVWTHPSGNLYLRWYHPNLTSRIGTDILLSSSVGLRHVGDAYYGQIYPGSSQRLVVSLHDGDANMIRAWVPGGTASAPTMARISADDFPRARNATVIGLCYDPTQERFIHLDRYAYFYTYSKYKDGGQIQAQYTYYDGDNSVYPAGTVINDVDVSGQVSGPHETLGSPLATYLMSKRAWPVITAPPAPDELVIDPTKVDKANRLGIYASIGSTPRFQAYLPVGVRSLPVTDELFTGSALINTSTVPSFDNAMVPTPGILRSQRTKVDGVTPMYQVLGDGSGNWGDLTVSPSGKVTIANDTGWNLLPLSSPYEQGAAGATYTPRYRVIGNVVEIRGIIKLKSGTFTANVNHPVGAVPSAYKPSAYKWNLVPGNSATDQARMVIAESGAITILPQTNAVYFALDTVYFID